MEMRDPTSANEAMLGVAVNATRDVLGAMGR